jgi:arylsulfatase A-like enzyme
MKANPNNYPVLFASLIALTAASAWASPGRPVGAGPKSETRQPNVLFILIDDHPAHMVSLLDESVVRTPNLERLAARGTWFSRGYNAAPVCAASRAAFLTGVHPSNSGAYYNAQGWTRTEAPISQATIMQKHFLQHGYVSAGYGKIDHSAYQRDTADAYTPGFRVFHRDRSQGIKTDAELVPHIIPETLRHPDPAYLPTRIGALPDDWDRDDPAKLQEDTVHANHAIRFLGGQHDRPFFLTVGFWRPHSERIVPKRYFDLYPLENIRIPESYLAGDLEDVPAVARWRATKRGTHAAVVNNGMWREYLRSFYAATTYVDEQIGRVLDALEKSPYADDTIIVFASDNGFHAGEKDMWTKFALWEQTNRVVFAISVPGLPVQRSHTPVGLIDIYPTLLALCGLPAPSPQKLDGIDLSPILKGESVERGRPVLSTYGQGNHSIRDARFRYIRYRNGDEELYDHFNDPHEWHNLAGNPAFADIKTTMAGWLPGYDAPEIEPAFPERGRGAWDGSELRAELFELLDRGAVPAQNYNRVFEDALK